MNLHVLARFLPLLVAVPAAAQTVYVTTRSDTSDFTGAKTVADLPGPDGLVSMREAITATNNTPGPQTVGFQIPQSDWGLGSTGPVIENGGAPWMLSDDDTTVDGTTQTAFSGDTNPNGPEVAFFNTHPSYLSSPMFSVVSSRNRFVGLGDMGNRGHGIALYATASDNVVVACSIGGPLFSAIRIEGDRNVIGGTQSGEGNRLSSGNDGVRIEANFGDVAQDNVVIGNELLTGSWNGVQIRGDATGNRIGGLGPGEGNRIAEAGSLGEHGQPSGAQIRVDADGNFVLGNLIGTDASGTAAASNTGDVGLELHGSNNVIRGNVIGGITGIKGLQYGIWFDTGATGNVVQGNAIGTDASGTIPIPNEVGVVFAVVATSQPSPTDNVLGGTGSGEGNTIAYNQEGGVRVTWQAKRNRISGNALYENDGAGLLPIDLGFDGPSANDPGDGDSGPNELMNHPVLASAITSAQGTVVTGTLDTTAPELASVELFSNPLPSFGNVVEAETFLGVATPRPDGKFVVHLPQITSGLALTATATDADGNTSELSPPRIVAASPWADLGSALAGTYGDPVLAGGGPLTAGSTTSVLVSNARESTPGLFVVGASALSIPLLGGTLVPAPDVLLPFTTDAAGTAAFTGYAWPAPAAGKSIWAQAWIIDPAAPQVLAASNAVRADAP